MYLQRVACRKYASSAGQQQCRPEEGEHPRNYLQTLPKDRFTSPRPAKYWHCCRDAFDMSLRVEQSRSRRGPARPCITHWCNKNGIHSVCEGGTE